MQQTTYEVHAFWDQEAQVWVAESDQVPGLITESETMEQLVQKLQVLIPELLEANGLLPGSTYTEIPFHLLSERLEMARCRVI